MTKIYHPNVGKDGELCANVYEKDWAPTQTTRDLIDIVATVLYSIDSSNPLNVEIATDYENNSKGAHETKLAWMKKYNYKP